MPPISNYSVGPGGFKFNPGTALNESYRDFFFLAQFPVKKITAFRVAPEGAGFAMVDEHVFHSGLMASAVNFGPDGALYIADWDGLWAPNDKGAIYRVDDPQMSDSAARREVRQVLRDGVQDLNDARLVELLGHGDRRLRRAAQFELAGRQRVQELLHVAADDALAPLARVHALWGLIQTDGGDIKSQLAGLLPWKAKHPQVRGQVARTAGDLRLPGATDPLVRLLGDHDQHVRYQAANALGKVGSADATSSLIELLADDQGRDPVIRHGAVMGLTGCAPTEDLVALQRHPSAHVRIGAVVALRRRRDPTVAVFLHDRDTRVVREAARAIHDDFSIEAALPDLARLLDSDATPEDEVVSRRAISANLRLGTAESAKRLGSFVVDASHAEILRIEALEALAVWDQRPLVDRVVGRVRKLSPRDDELGRETLQRSLSQIFASQDGQLIATAARRAQDLQLDISEDLLVDWISAESRPVVARVEALRLLESLGEGQLSHAVEMALTSSQPLLRIAALQTLSRQDWALAWRYIDRHWSTASLEEKQAMVALVGTATGEEADSFVLQRLDELTREVLDEGLQLDVVLAARARETPKVKSLLAELARRSSTEPLGDFRLALYGGRAIEGERLFRHHVNAQCARCHDAGGKGKQAGPILDGIADHQNREYLLEALVRPSASIAKGFESTMLELVSGKRLSGTILEEGENVIRLSTSDGKITSVRRDEIEFRAASQISSMPTMEKTLSLTEIRDLVAYLASLRK